MLLSSSVEQTETDSSGGSEGGHQSGGAMYGSSVGGMLTGSDLLGSVQDTREDCRGGQVSFIQHFHGHKTVNSCIAMICNHSGPLYSL